MHLNYLLDGLQKFTNLTLNDLSVKSASAVMVKMLFCGIEINELELQSRSFSHFGLM